MVQRGRGAPGLHRSGTSIETRGAAERAMPRKRRHSTNIGHRQTRTATEAETRVNACQPHIRAPA